MARVKRGVLRSSRRKAVLKKAKGFRGGRKNILRQANSAVKKAGQRAFDHRKQKKRTRRATWQVKISAAAKLNGTSYSKLMGGLLKNDILIDRKILATIAEHYPALFTKIASMAAPLVNEPKVEVKAKNVIAIPKKPKRIVTRTSKAIKPHVKKRRTKKIIPKIEKTVKVAKPAVKKAAVKKPAAKK